VLSPGQRPTRVRQWRDFEIDWDSLAFFDPRSVQFAGREG